MLFYQRAMAAFAEATARRGRSRSTFCIALRGWIELADLSVLVAVATVAEVDANQSPKAEE